MTNDKSPEQAAEEWAKSRYWDEENAGKAQVEMDRTNAIADYLEGYQRGKEEAERRIWDKLPYSYATREIKQIIFGGGELPSMKEATASDNPVVQVGEKHWRIKDPIDEAEYLHKVGNG